MAIQRHHNDDEQTNGLMISIVPWLGRRIRRAAAQSNLSVDEYVGRILEQVVPAETDESQNRSGRLNRAAVEDLKRFREELRLAHPDTVFEDSVELLRQAREERTRELEQVPTP